MEPKYKRFILRCRDCRTELNSTCAVPEGSWFHIRLSSGLVAKKCPHGCRSTCSDLNLNTELEEISCDAEGNPVLEVVR